MGASREHTGGGATSAGERGREREKREKRKKKKRRKEEEEVDQQINGQRQNPGETQSTNLPVTHATGEQTGHSGAVRSPRTWSGMSLNGSSWPSMQLW